MGKSNLNRYFVPNFRCMVTERHLGRHSRKRRLLQKITDWLNVKYARCVVISNVLK